MMYFYLSVTFTADLYYKHISVHCILTVFILSINALFSIFYSFRTTTANSIGFRFIQFKYHTLYSKGKIILFSFFTHRDMSNIVLNRKRALSRLSALKTVLGFYYSFVQSSTFSPGILENSLILFVTTVRFLAKP